MNRCFVVVVMLQRRESESMIQLQVRFALNEGEERGSGREQITTRQQLVLDPNFNRNHRNSFELVVIYTLCLTYQLSH